MDAAVAALVGAGLGAGIGALGALGAALIQQRHQSVRERLKIATDLGLAEHAMRVKEVERLGRGAVVPVSVYVAYHLDVLEAMASNTFDVDKVAAIDRKQLALVEAIDGRASGNRSRAA